MFAKRFTVVAAVAAALSAQPAAAAIVELNFQEQAGAGANAQYFGPNVYFDWQNNFNAAAFSGDYEFKFTYDTEAGPDYGLTLVSGRIGTYTDFAGWNASLIFNPNSRLFIQLVRHDQFGCCLHYTGGVYFDLRDDDGDIGSALPQAIALANLDTATASFEVRRAGGVGQGYKNVGYARFGGTVQVPTGNGGGGDGGQSVGGVPEPGVWALMILGFGGAGAMLRRRRLAAA